MVEYPAQQLDQTFHALSNPTRRQILQHLFGGKATILEIAALFDMSLNGVSKHIKVLEKASLIRREIVGRRHYCSLHPEPLREVETWLADQRRFWEASLDALDAFIEDQNERPAEDVP